MAKTVKLASPILRFLLRYTLGTWLKLRFRVHYQTSEIADIKPPFIVIGNHSFNWDPFLLSLPFKSFIHFVVSDEYFRFKPLQILIKAIGGIPKTKNTSDSNAVRKLLALKNQGAIIGIYPEGNRNWDGVTGPMYPSTAKVIKKFKIPVVSCVTTGNSLIHPRWAKHMRKGPLFMDYRLLFTPEKIEELTDKKIEDIMIAALTHDDHPDAVRKTMSALVDFKYEGQKLAETMELFLFQCPKCLCLDTMISKNNRFFCKECGFSVLYGSDAQFHNGILHFEEGRKTYHIHLNTKAVPGNPPFTTTKDWNRWQCENLENAIMKNQHFSTLPIIKENYSQDSPNATQSQDRSKATLLQDNLKTTLPQDSLKKSEFQDILKNKNAFLKTGKRTGMLKKNGLGTLILKKDHLVFVPEQNAVNNTVLLFPLEKITGLNIQYNNKIEFYHDTTIYRFSFPLENISVWKWHQAIAYAKNSLDLLNIPDKN